MPYQYITQTDVETYKNIGMTDDGAAQFAAMLPRMQAMVDQYCNRTWNFTNPVTEYFDMFDNLELPNLKDTFFTKAFISDTPYNSSFPQAGGIQSITIGQVNGSGGINLDLTYVYARRTYLKFWSWSFLTSLFNPFGYKGIQVVYNSDDAQNVPAPIQQALIEWISRKIDTSPDSNKETILVQAGTVQARFSQDKVGGIPDFVKNVLDIYRIPSLDHF